MSIARHKDGFFVVIVKEEDGKAFCKYSVDVDKFLTMGKF